MAFHFYQPPAQAAPIYRGGGTGVESDFGLRDYAAHADIDNYYRNQQNQQNYNYGIRQTAAGLATGGQIGAAVGSLRPIYDRFSEYSRTGGVSDAEQQLLELGAVRDSNNQYAADSRQVSDSAASRGMSADPMAMMAMRRRLGFQRTAARGQARLDVTRARQQGRLQATSGWAGVGGQMADLQARPTQENALSMLDGGGSGSSGGGYGGGGTGTSSGGLGLYDTWRNAQVGPDGMLASQTRPTPQNTGYLGTGGGAWGGQGGGGTRPPALYTTNGAQPYYKL
jgi:hypothetical protein